MPHRLAVVEPREGLRDLLEQRSVALNLLELGLAVLEHAGDDVADEGLGEVHQAVEFKEGHLGLDHPELGQVAAGLGLLGAEGGAEAVDLAEGHRVGLVVELARLREVGLLAEVGRLEEGAGALAGGRRKDGRVDEQEVVVVEVVANRTDDLGADAQDGMLPARANPEMTMVHQEGGAMLLRRDGVLLRDVEDLEAGGMELVAERGAGVFADNARDLDAALLGEPLGALKDLLGDVVLAHDALDDGRAVAELQEVDLAARADVVDPALERDGLVFVGRNLLDVDVRHGSAGAEEGSTQCAVSNRARSAGKSAAQAQLMLGIGGTAR